MYRCLLCIPINIIKEDRTYLSVCTRLYIDQILNNIFSFYNLFIKKDQYNLISYYMLSLYSTLFKIFLYVNKVHEYNQGPKVVYMYI